MPERWKVAVVDDHPLYREGVVHTISDDKRFVVVAEGGSADEALEIAEQHRPELMLLDISMPGNGIGAAARIALAASETATVMLTVSEAQDDIMAALAVGAKGYVLKGVSGQELVDILASVLKGGSYVPPSLAARLLTSMQSPQFNSAQTSSPVESLSDKETLILQLVAEGLTNKEVGTRLSLQEKTVKHYMTGVLSKLQARNRVEATIIAKKHWEGRI